MKVGKGMWLRPALAASLWVLATGQTVAGLVVELSGFSSLIDLVEAVLIAILLIGTTSLGVLLVIRTGNVIGWLFCLIGLNFSWGLWSVARGDQVGLVEDWLNGVLWWPSLLLIPAVILLFPDGRLPSRRWWPVWWLAGVGIGGLALSTLFGPTVFDSDDPAPFAGFVPEAVLQTLEIIGILVIPFLGAVVVAPILKYRKAESLERLQFKWFGLGAGITLIGVIAFQVLWWEQESAIPSVITVMALPVSVTMAILRYRLYEIDRLVSRTVTYSVVVGVVASAFVAIVVGVPLWLGVPEEEPLLVAVATLIAAAMFNPLRHRMRTWVDRRFNRARYDARLEVDRLGSRLRDEVDIEGLTSDLETVVSSTLEPDGVSVWVRGGDDGSYETDT